VIFVTGEPGIGKTAVVETFVAQAAAHPGLWVARGQCVEHYGPGEAYLPVLEAVGRLCRAPGHERLLTVLRQQAPLWMAQLPWLLSAAEREALQRELLGATQARMMREMAAVLETVTAETPLVLVLEDLHWSDEATMDLLAWLAQRPDSTRLLLIGTYRPVDVIVRGHPVKAVKQALQQQRRCQEVSLAVLSAEAVAEYLTARLPGSHLPEALTQLIAQRTDGHPFFLVTLVEDWLARGVLRERDGQWGLTVASADGERGVPASIRQMLALQFERLTPEEQRVLEAASAVGVTFSAAAVAAALARDVVAVEEECERLAQRQQWLRPAGKTEWPDGTVAGRYAFIHTLSQYMVYQRVAPARRVRLHQRIGTRLEEAYGVRQARDELGVATAGLGSRLE
jgi:predicted ATPase